MIKNLSYLFFLFLILVVSPSIQAQDEEYYDSDKSSKNVNKGSLTISGTMYMDGKIRLNGVNVVLMENGDVIKETRSDDNGKFSLKMALDKQFMVYFQKDDFVDKIIEVDTRNVPADERKYPMYYKNWQVDMIPTELNVDVSVLKKPVALVVYNPTEYGFSTDKMYERSVRPALKRLAEEVFDAYDDRAIQSEDALDDYMLAIKDGNMFLDEGDYENALLQYEAAKVLQPNETYPDKQIKKTMELLMANKSIDERYAEALEKADIDFADKNWQSAKKYYEQAHDYKPKMTYPKDQIDVILMNIAAEKALLSKEEQRARDAAYKATIASADSLFASASYSESKSKYKEALRLNSAKVYPQTKMDEIDAILDKMEGVNQAFTKLMSDANQHLDKKNYEEAREAYTQALGIKPNEEKPKQKLKEIDGILAGLAAIQAQQAEFEKKRLAAEQKEYDAIIVNADALMIDKSYIESKAEYQKALTIKKGEEYPKNQIKLINAELLKLEGLDNQYKKLMANAGKLRANGNLEGAKLEYQQALNLKPNEQSPKDAIADIDSKLAAITASNAAKQKAIDDKYNGCIAKGDELMTNEDYELAENSYKQALRIKPNEEYPKTQLSAIADKLRILAAEKAASEKAAQELERKEEKYNAVIVRADRLFGEKNYAEAKAEYENALLIFEGKNYPLSQISVIDSKMAQLALDAEAQAKLEAERKAKEEEYLGVIAKADAALEVKNFSEARLKYLEAQRILPEKDYPATQISKIEGLEQAEKNRVENQIAFDKLVKEGDEFIANGELEKGKYKYEAALKIFPSDAPTITKMRKVMDDLEKARKLAEFRAKNDTEFNRQLAIDYPNGLNETKKVGGKTITRIVIVADGRGDEYRKEKTSYATFYFFNNKQIDETTFNKETKGH